jgi:hypothetical protein
MMQSRALSHCFVFWALTVAWTAIGEASPLAALDEMERQGRGGVLTIQPSTLSADESLRLARRLEARRLTHDIIPILKFAHHWKRAQKEPAIVALELANEKLAKELVAIVRARMTLEQQVSEIDLDEGVALRRELERQPLTDCEFQVESGQFKPLTGKSFCALWDSGLLELLPSPTKLMTTAARVAALNSLTKLPRAELAKVSRTRSIMARYETRRAEIRTQIVARAAQEEALSRQLVHLVWNVTVEMSSRR